MNLFDRVRHIPHGASIILKWLGEGGRVAGPGEAQTRADICLKCAYNAKGDAVTTAVALATRDYLEVKNHLRLRVQGEKSLGRCEICTCVLRLQVHQPADKVKAELTEDEKSKLPAHCWKLKL